jgi:hypothetical protein
MYGALKGLLPFWGMIISPLCPSSLLECTLLRRMVVGSDRCFSKIVKRVASLFVLFARYHSGDQIKEVVIDGPRSTHRSGQKWVQKVVRKPEEKLFPGGPKHK